VKKHLSFIEHTYFTYIGLFPTPTNSCLIYIYFEGFSHTDFLSFPGPVLSLIKPRVFSSLESISSLVASKKASKQRRRKLLLSAWSPFFWWWLSFTTLDSHKTHERPKNRLDFRISSSLNHCPSFLPFWRDCVSTNPPLTKGAVHASVALRWELSVSKRTQNTFLCNPYNDSHHHASRGG
jgi:hypothetical protein